MFPNLQLNLVLLLGPDIHFKQTLFLALEEAGAPKASVLQVRVSGCSLRCWFPK